MSQQELKGKAKCLGWGFIDEAFGPVVSISLPEKYKNLPIKEQDQRFP